MCHYSHIFQSSSFSNHIRDHLSSIFHSPSFCRMHGIVFLRFFSGPSLHFCNVPLQVVFFPVVSLAETFVFVRSPSPLPSSVIHIWAWEPIPWGCENTARHTPENDRRQANWTFASTFIARDGYDPGIVTKIHGRWFTHDAESRWNMEKSNSIKCA